MNKYAIEVYNLSKQYSLNDSKLTHSLLREEISSLFSKLGIRKEKRLKRKTFWTLKNISFKILKGEVIGVIGPNGAGKSTLLKILSQITHPTSGKAILHGRVASLLEIGTGFNPELSGRENIYLNGSILGMSRGEIKNKIKEIIDFSGIKDFIDEPVKHYSSGMYVRLAFSIAAHLDPEILLIDEILAVGDAKFQKKSLGKVGDITRRENRTVLFVSHDLGAISKLCNKVILIDKGRIIKYGETDKVIKQYLSLINKNIHYSENKIDLKSRMGTHEIYITKVEILNKNREKIKSVKSGGRFIIRINYDIKKGEVIKNLLVGFLFKTDLDTPVFVQQNVLQGNDFGEITKKGYFEFEIDSLPVAPGGYLINCSLIKNFGIGGHYYDNINDALKFDVLYNDFFGTGISPSPEHGRIYLKGKWRHVV